MGEPIKCRPSVGSRLMNLRRQHNLTYEEVSSMLKMHKATYKRCEANAGVLSTEQLMRLASRYRVNLEYLQGLSPYPTDAAKTQALAKTQSGVKASPTDVIVFQAKTQMMDECYDLVNQVKRVIKEDIRTIIKRVQDEDADLLGQVGVELEKEVDEIFTRAIQRVEKRASDSAYIGGQKQ